LIWASPQPSTYSALCMMRGHASEGNVLEVWRGNDCVYKEVIGSTLASLGQS
jgi:hypothetical protein